MHTTSRLSMARRAIATLVVALALACSMVLGACSAADYVHGNNEASGNQSTSALGMPAGMSDPSVDLSTIPEYTDSPYFEINDNEPVFTDEELDSDVFESYSSLDKLGRCGTAYAMLGRELMPTEGRGDIHFIKPTGWHHSEYDFVDGLSLYNRSHLIAFKLAGENANEKNLITGTRYMNATGMLMFEDMVSDYIYRTRNHVLYRVTPIFYGNEMVARGVHMEAQSVEDDGEGVSFNVYCYNVQPGVLIDYANGDNWLEEGNAGFYHDDSPYAPADSAKR